MDDSTRADGVTLGRLAHRMNNAVAYVVTNLSLLQEELDALKLPPETAARLGQLVEEATAGAERVSGHVRELRVLGWSEGRHPLDDDSLDDTWDKDRRHRRVLVVDDEPYILASIRRVLRHYDVVLAECGQQAAALLEDDDNFDLVLCDLVMSPMNGPQLYAWAQENRKALSPRFIFMTAGAFTGEIRQFLAQVPNPVLHKPFDTKTLRWVIAQTFRTPSRV